MYKSIVVPIELEHAERAKAMLDEAKKLVDEGGRVNVINVVPDVPGLITAGLPDGLVQKAAKEARSALLEMVSEAGLTAEVQIRSGSPHHAIVGLADEVGADLILIASHRPGVRDYVLGATAASVVRHAKCSVLVQR